MPLDGSEFWGTERDGSPNLQYSKYSYQNGLLKNSGMTLEEMRSLIIDRMEKEKIPGDIIEAAVNRLPYLERWKTGVRI